MENYFKKPRLLGVKTLNYRLYLTSNVKRVCEFCYNLQKTM